MIRKNKHTQEEDDGRTIADMNLDGMPWFVPGDEKRGKTGGSSKTSPLSDKELRIYRFAALKAALVVVLIFGLAFFLFIAFCDFIWFR